MADKRIPVAKIRDAWLDPTINTTVASAVVGLARSSMWRRAKLQGLPPRKRGRAYQITDTAYFTRLWNGGVRVDHIAAALGVGRGAVFRTRIRLDLAPRPHGLKPVALDEFLLREGLAASAAETRAAMRMAEMVDTLFPAHAIVRGRATRAARAAAQAGQGAN